jgi:hypothetical protein
MGCNRVENTNVSEEYIAFIFRKETEFDMLPHYSDFLAREFSAFTGHMTTGLCRIVLVLRKLKYGKYMAHTSS